MGKIPWRRDQLPTLVFFAFPDGSDRKESTCNAGDLSFDYWVGKISLRRKWLPTPVFLPGEIHRQERGGLQSMGSQRIRNDLAAKQQNTLEPPLPFA